MIRPAVQSLGLHAYCFNPFDTSTFFRIKIEINYALKFLNGCRDEKIANSQNILLLVLIILVPYVRTLPVPVAARSKA